jgi:O-acetylhomoserine (thiol)-lyase
MWPTRSLWSCNEEQQRKAGINPDVVRLSIGIEDVKDLLWDLDQALKQAARKA